MSEVLDIKEVVGLIETYKLNNGYNDLQLRLELIDKKFVKIIGDKEKAYALLLHVSKDDKEYINLLCAMIPAFDKMRGNFVNSRPNGYRLLVDSLYKCVSMDYDNLVQIGDEDLEGCDELGQYDFSGIDEYSIQKELDLLNHADKATEGEVREAEEEAKDDMSDQHYIYQLNKMGYKEIDNESNINGAINLYSKIRNMVVPTYKVVPSAGFGVRDKNIIDVMDDLESMGVDTSKADLWSDEIQNLAEEVKFRVFIKEDAMSFSFILKLPGCMDDESFKLSEVKNKMVNVASAMEDLPRLFKNKDKQKGNVYTCSYFIPPNICNLGTVYDLDCTYNGITFILAKGLLNFKNSAWELRPYLRQAKGIDSDTPYASLNDFFDLGEGIAMGIYPGGLQTRRFLSNSGCTAALMQGGAGSGKTAFNDSILVQSLAYKGFSGEGAVILVDGKDEWASAWTNVFKSKGIANYCFGKVMMNANDLKKEVLDKKSGEYKIEPLGFDMKDNFASAVFIDCVFDTIQHIKKGLGDPSIDTTIAFNKHCAENNVNSYGFSKLPRVTIIVDEMNVLKDESKVAKDSYGKCFTKFLRAKETRSGGLIWFVVGQNLTDSVIPSNEKANMPYMVCGNMRQKDYDYHEVTVNPEVVKFERLNKKKGAPPPIMSQGMFYAGDTGDTMLVKCMYLPTSQRGDALDDLQSNFEGQQLLHDIVRFGAKEGIFDRSHSVFGYKTNIVYGVLKNIGIITDSEFQEYTNRLFQKESAVDSTVSSGTSGVEGKVDIDKLESIYGAKEVEGDVDAPLEYAVTDIVDDNVATVDDGSDDDAYYENRAKMYETEEVGTQDMPNSNVRDVVKGVAMGAGAVLGAKAVGDVVRGSGGVDSKVIPFPGSATVEEYQSGSVATEVDVEDYGGYEGVDNDSTVEGDGNSSNYNSGYSPIEPQLDLNKDDPIYKEPAPTPNTFNGCEVYDEELDLGGMNPFDARASKTVFGGIDAFKYMNKIVENAIKKAYHGFDRVREVRVADNGLFINNIAFRPFVPKVVVDSLPVDIRNEVARGNIVEFFDFKLLFKMHSLDTLVIDNVRLAESRVRRELKMKRNMTWDLLYDNFNSLQYLEIGGSRITTPEEAERYTEGSQGDYEFQEKIREAFSFDSDILDRVKSPVQKLWRSRPVAIVTGALGGVVGTQVVLGMASLMGAWGILFAGLAGYGAYNTYIKGNRSSRGSSSYSDNQDYGSIESLDSGKSKSKKGSNKRRK